MNVSGSGSDVPRIHLEKATASSATEAVSVTPKLKETSLEDKLPKTENVSKQLKSSQSETKKKFEDACSQLENSSSQKDIDKNLKECLSLAKSLAPRSKHKYIDNLGKEMRKAAKSEVDLMARGIELLVVGDQTKGSAKLDQADKAAQGFQDMKEAIGALKEYANASHEKRARRVPLETTMQSSKPSSVSSSAPAVKPEIAKHPVLKPNSVVSVKIPEKKSLTMAEFEKTQRLLKNVKTEMQSYKIGVSGREAVQYFKDCEILQLFQDYEDAGIELPAYNQDIKEQARVRRDEIESKFEGKKEKELEKIGNAMNNLSELSEFEASINTALGKSDLAKINELVQQGTEAGMKLKSFKEWS